MFHERAAAVDPIVRAIESALQQSTEGAATTVACYRGFDVTIRPLSNRDIRLAIYNPNRVVNLDHALATPLEQDQLAAYGVGLFQRLAHLVGQFALERRLTSALERSRSDLATLGSIVDKQFEHELELAQMRADLQRINHKLEQLSTQTQQVS